MFFYFYRMWDHEMSGNVGIGAGMILRMEIYFKI
jgi:hypothetical protein